jgi:aerobic-type carbon monoxide dehydrogenase small subunit (CoxS/CutS family)
MPRKSETEKEPVAPARATSSGSGGGSRGWGGLSRRAFLTHAGVAAAGSALLDGCAAGVAESKSKSREGRSDALVQAEPQAEIVGPGPVKLALNINGQTRQVEVEPRTTLADLLRDDLDMTGTKVVCDRGACSACTVMLDGATVCSCMTLAIDAVGREIRTIEGLARGDQLHPVQEAFVEHDALQCGYCTPGMVMSCAGLLERNARPSLDDVKQAVRGNLCRCGTYPKVFDATLAAAKQMHAQPLEAAGRKGA